MNGSRPVVVGERRRVGLALFRAAVVLLVIAGMAWMVRRSAAELARSPLNWNDVAFGWLGAAAVAYGVGMLPAAIFWHRVLRAWGQAVTFRRAIRAFFASQLGKYVPGKAMVVVVRVAMIAGPSVETRAAVASVFVETLTWMAVGGAIGSLLVLGLPAAPAWLAPLGIAVAAGAAVATSPPLLQRVLPLVFRAGGEGNGVAPRLPVRTWAFGWLGLSCGWASIGLSLWLVLVAIPGPATDGSHYGLALACAALSVVIGFVSLIPGGLGVRELVIAPLLAPTFGPTKALVAAVVARIVWMAVELAIVGIIQGGSSRNDPATHPSPRRVGEVD